MRRRLRIRTTAGFTLTELAVVFAIVALLVGGAMYTLSAQTEIRAYDDTRRRLEQAREFPESGRVVPEFGRDEIRELIEWPYRLVYRVDADAIEVLSVLHGRQDLHELR